MTYELAKQLKDAWFPQELSNGNWAYCLDCGETSELHLMHNDNDEGNFVGNDYSHRQQDYPEGNFIKSPTLSELIEACGDANFALRKIVGGWQIEWEEEPLEETYLQGKTPEEAVARLYLALYNNKHDKNQKS